MVSAILSSWSVYFENRLPLSNGHSNQLMVNTLELTFFLSTCTFTSDLVLFVCFFLFSLNEFFLDACFHSLSLGKIDIVRNLCHTHCIKLVLIIAVNSHLSNCL